MIVVNDIYFPFLQLITLLFGGLFVLEMWPINYGLCAIGF